MKELIWCCHISGKVCHLRLSELLTVMPGLKPMARCIHQAKWEHLFSWRWRKQLRVTWVQLLRMPLSLFQRISTILRDRCVFISYLHITATSYIYLNSLALPHASRFSISCDEHVHGKVVKYKRQCSQWLTTDNTEESPAVCISCGLSLQAVHTILLLRLEVLGSWNL